VSTNYLERFRSGLRQAQSNQILRLLAQEKQRGNITTVEEFKNRLSELTAQLSSTTITPTLQIFLAEVGAVIDSDSYNFMLERIEDDLEVAFEEMNTIDEVVDAHETIINDVVLKNLELALDDLESKIEAFEFINKTTKGFDNAIFNTFRITQQSRSGGAKEINFIDPKTLSLNSADNEALVDFIGEKLLLGSNIDETVELQAVRQVFDSEATGSEITVDFDDSDLNNIIDNRIGSFWVHSTMLSAPRDEEGVVTKLEIDLGTVRTINTLQLEPILAFPVELIGIDYLDSNNVAQSILSSPLDIRSTNKLLFNSISTEKLFLRFRNRNYQLSQYQEKKNNILPRLARDFTDFNDSIASSTSNFTELIKNPRLLDALGLNETEGEKRSFYEYLIGFDNIRVGLNSFDEVSVFTSKSERVENLGMVALKTTEKRPFGAITGTNVEYTLDTHPASFDTFFHASLEYYVVKRDYRENDSLLDTTLLPIVPLSQTRVRHERLYLTERSPDATTANDVGLLQFFTLHDPYHPSPPGSGDPGYGGFDDALNGTIRVYRNGQELLSGDVDILDDSDWWKRNTDFSQDIPAQGTPMRYAIQIRNPNPNSIYTVSYTPALSTTDQFVPEATTLQYLTANGLKFVDLTGTLDAWLGKDNVLRFKNVKAGVEIAYSVVNLVVVLRRNSANVNLTPVLEDYLLATGRINDSKFD
jgi:hypothetical protein